VEPIYIALVEAWDTVAASSGGSERSMIGNRKALGIEAPCQTERGTRQRAHPPTRGWFTSLTLLQACATPPICSQSRTRISAGGGGLQPFSLVDQPLRARGQSSSFSAATHCPCQCHHQARLSRACKRCAKDRCGDAIDVHLIAFCRRSSGRIAGKQEHVPTSRRGFQRLR
jgi:hypothetical protein